MVAFLYGLPGLCYTYRQRWPCRVTADRESSSHGRCATSALVVSISGKRTESGRAAARPDRGIAVGIEPTNPWMDGNRLLEDGYSWLAGRLILVNRSREPLRPGAKCLSSSIGISYDWPGDRV
jgi:hypothetical protein